MSLKDKIKSSPRLKKTALWLMASRHDPKPRWFIRALVNPLKHNVAKTAVIRTYVRMDTFPYNKLNIGDRSVIEDFSIVNNAVGDVYIGKNSMIGMSNVIIGPVQVGDNVMLAQHVVASGLNHGYEDVTLPPKQQSVNCKKILIEDNVWIGANAVITAGVTVGKHSVVGAGSVVTKDVPPYSVVAGNPARLLKKYNFENQAWERCR